MEKLLSLPLAAGTAPQWGSDILHILQFTLISLIVFVIGIKIIDLGTPGRLVQEILEKGNLALGTYLSGAIIGLGVVMHAILTTPTDTEAGAIHFTNSVAIDAILNTVVWGLIAPIIQLLAMRVFDWITPGIDFRKALADDNRAVGVMLCGLNIAIGFVMAALFAG